MNFKWTWQGVWSAIKMLLIAGLVFTGVQAAKGIYSDLMERNDRMIDATAQRVAAEAQLVTLKQVNKQMQLTNEAQSRALDEARRAVLGLNDKFNGYRRDQQQLMALVNSRAFAQALQSKPTDETAAQATALMDEVNRQFEETFP